MRNVFILFLGVFLIVSCGYKEGIIQKSEMSFLKFTGNFENATVQIDDKVPFVLKSVSVVDNSEREATDNILYQISPGKHVIKVYRGGELLINRILLLENQVITEVRIP